MDNTLIFSNLKSIQFYLFFFSLILALSGNAQPNTVLKGDPPKIKVFKANEKITIDASLDEAAWLKAIPIENFTQYNPTDTLPAIQKTEVFVCYDDDNIYIAGICHTSSKDLVVPSLKRDYGFRGNDNLTFLLDMFNDKTNAFAFGVNPLGVLREALIRNGGRTFRDFSFAWDNKWNCASTIEDDKWITEVVIPLSTLRFNNGTSKMRFNTYRGDTQANEITSWIRIPDNNILADLTFMGELHFEEPLVKKGKNISIIPYVSGAVTRDFEDLNQEKAILDSGIGGDAKIAVTSGLNLDLTLNPDFSQVEVDRQVTNLDRFEIFFPERRQFFLENADLFGAFGNNVMNPFFSRRIGVATDTSEDKTIQNTIYGGLRLSGKLNEKLRVGLLNMQTASQIENDLPSYNFSVLAVEQQVFDRSSIAFGFVNKQALNKDEFDGTNDVFNRVGILEYRLASQDSKWTGKLSLMKAFTESDEDNSISQFTNLRYNSKRWSASIENAFIGSGFDAQVGFVPRKDILRTSPRLTFNFFPANEKIRRSNLIFQTDWLYKFGNDDNEIVTTFTNIEKSYGLRYIIDYVKTSRVEFGINTDNILLLDDFDPTRIQDDTVFLSAGETFTNYAFDMEISSDRRKRTMIRLEPIVGKFFGGFRAGLGSRLSYRIQPYANLSLRVNYNYIDIGRNFEQANLWLIGPQFNLTFSKNVFLTTFIQYNSQADNLNINTRFQWRFAPVSDFFLVYTDNYLSESFNDLQVNNRGLVAKFTYWLNL